MKCIGRKSDLFLFSFIIIFIALGLIIGMMAFYADPFATAYMILMMLVIAGLLVWQGYYVFMVPSEIVFFDEKEKKLIIHAVKGKTEEVYLKDIRHVSLERKGRNAYDRLELLLDGGSIITASGISRYNEILDNITVIRK